MKDNVSPFHGERYSRRITDAASDNSSRPRWTAKVRLPAVGEVIEDGHAGAGSNKAVSKVTSDESGAASDQHSN
jgi:hypothetical protein